MSNFLTGMGRVGAGIDQAAVTRSNAQISRLASWEAEQRANEIARMQQVNAQTRERLAGLDAGPADFEAIARMNMEQFGQPMGSGQQLAMTGDPEFMHAPVGSTNRLDTPSPAAGGAAPAPASGGAPVRARDREATASAAPTAAPEQEAAPTAGLSLHDQWENATPEERQAMLRGQGIHQVAPESYLIGGQGILRGLDFARRGLQAQAANRTQLSAVQSAQTRATSPAATADQIRREAAYSTYIRPVAETPRAGSAIASLGTAGLLDAAGTDTGTSVEQSTGVQETPRSLEEKGDELMDATPEQAKRAVSQDRTPGNQPTAKVYNNVNHYLANPHHITPDMNHVLRQREVLRALADYHIQSNNFDTAGQMMVGIADMDQSLFTLQGMQGVSELNNNGDPRRLNAVLTHYSGVPTQIVPHGDGTFHVERNGQVSQQNLTLDQVSTMSAQVFSQQAREAATQMQQEYAKKALEFKFWSMENHQGLMRDMQMAYYNNQLGMQMEAFKQQAEGMGIKLHNGINNEVYAIFSMGGQQILTQILPPEAEQSAKWPGQWFGRTGTDRVPARTENISTTSLGLQM